MAYSRKISADEAQKNAVLIDAKSLKMFPDVGKEFRLKVGKKSVSANVNNVGDAFYMHLFSSLVFRKGQKVSISKGAKGAFELKISK